MAYQNPWLTIYHDEVTRPDGSPGIYGVVHFRHAAVGVVAIDGNDRVALVSQHRYTLDAPSLEIPEGGAQPDEDPLDGARRELREEAGVEAANWVELCRTHLSNSVSDEEAIIYLASDLCVGPPDLEASEHDLTCRWVPFEAAMGMIEDGTITDAITVVALQRLALDRARGSNATPATPAGDRDG